DVPGNRPALTPHCVAENIKEYDPCAADRDGKFKVITNAMWEAAKSEQSVSTIDLTPYFCDDDKCHSMIGGVLVYFDAHHLTATYSISMAPLIAPAIESAISHSRV